MIDSKKIAESNLLKTEESTPPGLDEQSVRYANEKSRCSYFVGVFSALAAPGGAKPQPNTMNLVAPTNATLNKDLSLHSIPHRCTEAQMQQEESPSGPWCWNIADENA